MTATAVISTPLKWSHFRNARSQEQPINSETCSHYQFTSTLPRKGSNRLLGRIYIWVRSSVILVVHSHWIISVVIIPVERETYFSGHHLGQWFWTAEWMLESSGELLRTTNVQSTILRFWYNWFGMESLIIFKCFFLKYNVCL